MALSKIQTGQVGSTAQAQEKFLGWISTEEPRHCRHHVGPFLPNHLHGRSTKRPRPLAPSHSPVASPKRTAQITKEGNCSKLIDSQNIPKLNTYMRMSWDVFGLQGITDFEPPDPPVSLAKRNSLVSETPISPSIRRCHAEAWKWGMGCQVYTLRTLFYSFARDFGLVFPTHRKLFGGQKLWSHGKLSKNVVALWPTKSTSKILLSFLEKHQPISLQSGTLRPNMLSHIVRHCQTFVSIWYRYHSKTWNARPCNTLT